jgi:hypothetical protein
MFGEADALSGGHCPMRAPRLSARFRDVNQKSHGWFASREHSAHSAGCDRLSFGQLVTGSAIPVLPAPRIPKTTPIAAGTTLCLTVFNGGALFMAGDGHGRQDDGEVCITAWEIGLSGTFRLTVRNDMELDFPFAENATHLMSIGLGEDLDDAAKQAVRAIIKHICLRTNLSRNQAYYAVLVGGQSTGHPMGGPQQRRPHDARQGASVTIAT